MPLKLDLRSPKHDDILKQLSENIQKQEGVKVGEAIALHLRFSISINIGDVSTGLVKKVMDRLYPIIGGTEKTPEDWRVEELLVEKVSFQTLEIRI